MPSQKSSLIKVLGVERLTGEQIRLLDELKALHDDGVLTQDEFQAQVDRVLGRKAAPSEPAEPGDSLSPIDGGVDESRVEGALTADDSTKEADAPTESAPVESEIQPPTDEASSLPPTEEPQPVCRANVEQPVTTSTARRRRIIGIAATLCLLVTGAVVVAVVVATDGNSASPQSSLKALPTTVAKQTSSPTIATSEPSTTTTTTSTVPETTTTTTTVFLALDCRKGHRLHYRGPFTEDVVAFPFDETASIGVFETLQRSFVAAMDGSGRFNIFGSGFDFKVTNQTQNRWKIRVEYHWRWEGGSSQKYESELDLPPGASVPSYFFRDVQERSPMAEISVEIEKVVWILPCP